MPYNRKAIAPWSTESEQGIESATVDSNIETPQYLQPVVNTGTIDLNGNWIGNATSDRVFKIDAAHLAIANGGDVLVPQAQPDFIDMTGYTDLFIAIKPSNGGNYAIVAVMGPDTNTFANLTPLASARTLRIFEDQSATSESAVNQSAEDCQSDLWNIFGIQGRLANQKNLQFKLTNNSGGNSDITFAYLRVV